MGSTNKGFSLLLVVILAVSSLIIVESANAQSIPKPSIPEFTVKYLPSHYNVTTTNPYTGKNSTQQVDNGTLEISITNQKYAYSNGSTFNLYYNIRFKGTFEEKWTALYGTVRLFPNHNAYLQYRQSNLDTYKVEYISAPDLPWDYSPISQSSFQYTVSSMPTADYPSGGQLDFQVKAMVGHESTYFGGFSEIGMGGNDYPAVAYDTSSDWSTTQTVTLLEISSSTSPSPNPTPTPTVPELQSWTIPLLLTIMLVSAGLLVYHKKHKHKTT